jgi:hypothetical protein
MLVSFGLEDGVVEIAEVPGHHWLVIGHENLNLVLRPTTPPWRAGLGEHHH